MCAKSTMAMLLCGGLASAARLAKRNRESLPYTYRADPMDAPNLTRDEWRALRAKVHERKQPDLMWGDLEEDDRADEVHCARTGMLADQNIAEGLWPLADDFSAQVPCSGGQAAGYDCKDVDLLGHVPLGSFNSQGGNDIWGWTDPTTQHEYALIGLREGTGFVDVTNPTEPVIVGRMPTATSSSTWRDIKVFDNRAYVVSEASNHGMQVFDLTRLRGRTSAPSTPDQPDYRMTDFGQSHNIVINEETGRAFAVGARSLCRGGLVIIDISSPEPRFEGCFSADGYTHDAQCVIYKGPDAAYRGKEICFAYNEDTITIVDVSRGAGGAWRSPTQISKLGYEGSRYTHQGWLDESHSFAYMNDELDEGSCCTGNTYTKTYIVNVTSLSSPSLDSIHRSSMISTDHNNYVVGDKLYQSNYVAGLRILQIQEDFKLEEVAYFVTPSAWSVYPYFPSGNIIVSSIPGGLFVLRQYSGPPTPAPPTPAPPPPGTWELSGSGCEMDGNCIQSRNHPSSYGNSEACTITVFNVPLATEAFDTESRYDYLRAGGVGYSGSSGPPNGVYDGTITWSSDYSVTRSGWRLCRTD